MRIVALACMIVICAVLTCDGAVAIAATLQAADAQALSEAARTLRALSGMERAGPWRFHWPAEPGGERPDLDDSGWAQVWPEHRWDRPQSAAWYRMVVTVPERVGQAPLPRGPIILRVAADDDGEIYVDGRLAQKFHWDQGQAVLRDTPKPGERIAVAVKVINSGGPGRLLWARIEYGGLSQMQDEMARHSVRLDFVRELLETEDEVEPRFIEAAREAVESLNWEVLARDPGVFRDCIAASRRALGPLSELAKKYSLYLVGHAHIDMNWLWLWPETIAVCHDTWRQAVRFMDEFPGFCFSESQPAAYRAIEQHHPDLFEEIKKRIATGQWDYVGATWVQGDTNMASGEALCRQLLTSREYAMEKFGRWTEMAWLPDNFGHAWTVPTIFSDAGIKWYYFARCGPGFPLFWWEGPDGSRLAAYNYGGYSWNIDPGVVRIPLDVKRRVGVRDAMIAYGVGDHGGGPTRADIQEALALQKEQVAPRIVFARTDQYFEAALRDNPNLPVWRGEMNFTFRGCYTTHSDMKRRNRELENLLPAAEAAAVAAWLFGGRAYDNSAFMEAWRNVCFNQFHDLLPGSAIHDSYKYCHELYNQAERTAWDELRDSLAALAKQVDTRGEGLAVLVWNRLGWDREDYVTVAVQQASPAPLVAVGPDKTASPAQILGRMQDRSLVAFRAKVPACGWAVYHLRPANRPSLHPVKVEDLAHSVTLENEYLRAVVDKTSGTIKSLTDKQLGRELVDIGGRLGLLQMLWEEPHSMSAWEIGRIRWTDDLSQAEQVAIEHSGPCIAAVRVVHQWGKSTFTQRIVLRSGERHLDFDMSADWKEVGNSRDGSPMLKVAFPLRMRSPVFTCEIPFGTIERSLDGQDVPAQKWVDLSECRQVAAPGAATPVDLTEYFNQDVFAEAAEADGGDFDYGGIAYPAEMLSASKNGIMTWQGVPWRAPTTQRGARNAVRCDGQTIRLPAAHADSLIIFGASAPGGSGGLAELVFTDGSREATTLSFSDWCFGPGAGEEIVLRWPYRYQRGEKTSPEVRIFARRIPIPPGKRLAAIVLPREARLRIFAMTLAPRVERIGRWGVALLNDCKYGHDAQGSTLRLTLLRASYEPDPEPDIGSHQVRYSLVPHEKNWSAASVVREAEELNSPLVALVVDAHAGGLPPAGSVVQVSPSNVVLSCVKKAEHSDSVIVRWYEAEGRQTDTVVTTGFALKAAELTNVVEAARRGGLRAKGRTVRVRTPAHGIVTIRLVPAR
ncbi:MAG: alpha-mannosidase [Armatimonadetes bacterium]|nr:alpha-mannosidase [Armatimonadota bacterium]